MTLFEFIPLLLYVAGGWPCMHAWTMLHLPGPSWVGFPFGLLAYVGMFWLYLRLEGRGDRFRFSWSPLLLMSLSTLILGAAQLVYWAGYRDQSVWILSPFLVVGIGCAVGATFDYARGGRAGTAGSDEELGA